MTSERTYIDNAPESWKTFGGIAITVEECSENVSVLFHQFFGVAGDDEFFVGGYDPHLNAGVWG